MGQKMNVLLASVFCLSSMGYGTEPWDRFWPEVTEQRPSPEAALVMLQSRTPDEQKQLCDDILKPEFLDIAHQSSVSIFTRNALINYCQSFSLPKEEVLVNDLESDRYPKGPQEWQSQQRSVSTLEKMDFDTQGSEPISYKNDRDVQKLDSDRIKAFEEIQKIKEDLRGPTYSKGKHSENIQTMSDAITDFQTRLQNVDLDVLPEQDQEMYRTMITDMQIQLINAEDQVAEARRAYDDLSVAIGFLRDDISEYKRGRNIGDFDPVKYQDAVHEDYLQAISHPDVMSALPAVYADQIKGAQKLWADAQAHLNNAQDILQNLSHG